MTARCTRSPSNESPLNAGLSASCSASKRGLRFDRRRRGSTLRETGLSCAAIEPGPLRSARVSENPPHRRRREALCAELVDSQVLVIIPSRSPPPSAACLRCAMGTKPHVLYRQRRPGVSDTPWNAAAPARGPQATPFSTLQAATRIHAGRADGERGLAVAALGRCHSSDRCWAVRGGGERDLALQEW